MDSTLAVIALAAIVAWVVTTACLSGWRHKEPPDSAPYETKVLVVEWPNHWEIRYGRGPETYVWKFPRDCPTVHQNVARWAGNPDLAMTWLDAYNVVSAFREAQEGRE